MSCFNQQKRILLHSALYFIKFYQKVISPFLGKHCRFYPTCSNYSYSVIKKHGILKGMFFSIKRISKCHPFNKGGVDLP